MTTNMPYSFFELVTAQRSTICHISQSVTSTTNANASAITSAYANAKTNADTNSDTNGKPTARVGLGSNTNANKAIHDETGMNASSTEIIVRLNFNTTPTKSKSCRTQAAPT